MEIDAGIVRIDIDLTQVEFHTLVQGLELCEAGTVQELRVLVPKCLPFFQTTKHLAFCVRFYDKEYSDFCFEMARLVDQRIRELFMIEINKAQKIDDLIGIYHINLEDLKALWLAKLEELFERERNCTSVKELLKLKELAVIHSQRYQYIFDEAISRQLNSLEAFLEIDKSQAGFYHCAFERFLIERLKKPMTLEQAVEIAKVFNELFVSYGCDAYYDVFLPRWKQLAKEKIDVTKTRDELYKLFQVIPMQMQPLVFEKLKNL